MFIVIVNRDHILLTSHQQFIYLYLDEWPTWPEKMKRPISIEQTAELGIWIYAIGVPAPEQSLHNAYLAYHTRLNSDLNWLSEADEWIAKHLTHFPSRCARRRRQ